MLCRMRQRVQPLNFTELVRCCSCASMKHVRRHKLALLGRLIACSHDTQDVPTGDHLYEYGVCCEPVSHQITFLILLLSDGSHVS